MSDTTETNEITGSIFDGALDINIDEIPDNPNHLPEDVYTCRVTKAVMALTKKKDKVGLTITYQITEGPFKTSFPFSEWLQVPRSSDIHTEDDKVEAQRMLSKIKNRYIAMGIPADEMKDVQTQDLLNRLVKVRTKNKTQDGTERINISSVMAVDGEGSESGFDLFAKDSNTPPI